MTDIPHGTRVKYNSLVGTVVDPDGPLGQPSKGYDPGYEAVWVHWDRSPMPEGSYVYWYDSDGNSESRLRPPMTGGWIGVDDSALEIIPPYEESYFPPKQEIPPQ